MADAFKQATQRKHVDVDRPPHSMQRLLKRAARSAYRRLLRLTQSEERSDG